MVSCRRLEGLILLWAAVALCGLNGHFALQGHVINLMIALGVAAVIVPLIQAIPKA